MMHPLDAHFPLNSVKPSAERDRSMAPLLCSENAMSSMLFYQNISPLNDKQHASLRISPVRNYRFTAHSNSVPVLSGEFADCARHYPIVFARSDSGVVPVAMLGLRDRDNLFVDALGRWSATYVPAFVRRYPFVIGAGEGGQMVVCIDEQAACLSHATGEPLFIAGQPAPALKQAMGFLREFQSAATATAAMAARLDELALFRDADSLAQLKNGRQFRLTGMCVVDEQRLAALDDTVVLELFKSGTLRLIHMHLMSLGNLTPLIDRLSLRDAQAGKPVDTQKSLATV